MIFNPVWLPARQTGSRTRTKVLFRIMLHDTTACEDDLVKQALISTEFESGMKNPALRRGRCGDGEAGQGQCSDSLHWRRARHEGVVNHCTLTDDPVALGRAGVELMVPCGPSASAG